MVFGNSLVCPLVCFFLPCWCSSTYLFWVAGCFGLLCASDCWPAFAPSSMSHTRGAHAHRSVLYNPCGILLSEPTITCDIWHPNGYNETR